MADANAKTALVAGGGGFLGSSLVDALLAEGATVICLDSWLTGRRRNLRHLERESRFDCVEADVIDALPAKVARIRFTHIYNLACPGAPPRYQADPEHTMLTNVVGTSNLLRLAERKGARFLLASTSEVYGDPETHPQLETYSGRVDCTGPRACYEEGKRAAETLAFDYRRSGRADVRVARIFNTYGPRMRRDDGRVISNLLCQALAGEDITLYGDGSQTRSFCYVDDMVDGLMRLMDSGVVDGPVNLGNPDELTISELAKKVLRLTGSRSRIVCRPLPADDPRRRRPDIARARALLGWAPKVALDEGLEATVAWFAGEQKSSRMPIRTGRPAPPRGPVVDVAAE